ncbi:MAG: cysteine hydrolase [Oscillospiraceae bacterium]|nr:cysteine hydrolase [Oscillospiraceae bacterium]
MNKNKLTKIFSCVALLFYLSSCASGTTKIEYYQNPQKVLLVIDMQIDYLTEDGKYPIEISQMDNLITTVNEIINEFHNNDIKVIYFRNIFTNTFLRTLFNFPVIEGTPGVEIDSRINIVSEYIFDKYSGSAFSNIEFEDFLIQNQINELYLVGVAADECVYDTALAGLKRGYIVNFYANAVGAKNDRNIDRAISRINEKGANIVYH